MKTSKLTRHVHNSGNSTNRWKHVVATKRTPKLNGYRILTIQNTIGKVMEHIVAGKLSRYLEDRKILPANQGASDRGNAHGEMQLHDVYERFQRKEQALAVAIDLEQCQNTV